jgi:hypothetical protein
MSFIFLHSACCSFAVTHHSLCELEQTYLWDCCRSQEHHSTSNRKNFSSKGTSRNSQNNSTVLDYIGGMGNWVVIYKSLQTCLSESGPERKVQVFRETTTSMGASERYTLRGFPPGHDNTLPNSSNPAQNSFFFPSQRPNIFGLPCPAKCCIPLGHSAEASPEAAALLKP